METASGEYISKLLNLVEEVREDEKENFERVAQAVVEVVEGDNLIHVLGTGHSAILAQEVFGRAGGFAPVNAMLDENLLVSAGLKYASIERLEGYGKLLFDYYEVSVDDLLIVVSNSGVNAVPVDVALSGVERGVTTVAVTSLDYSRKIDSNHSSGKKLCDIAHIVIDNHTPPGDAIVDVGDLPLAVGPSTTIIGAVILNSIFVEAAELLCRKGGEVPVFKSGNLDGADRHNEKLFDRYRDRIVHY